MLKSSLSVFDGAIKTLVEREEPTGAVVFYGSSTFAVWGHERLKAQMRDIPAVNRGFGGSTAEQALYYYDAAVKPLKPRALVWYEGDNDLPCGYSPEETFFLTERVFEWVRKDFTDIKIFILPTKICPARAAFKESCDLYRAMLYNYAKENERVFYIEYFDMLYNGSETRLDIFEEDKLHFNAKGYEELSAIVYKSLKDNL